MNSNLTKKMAAGFAALAMLGSFAFMPGANAQIYDEGEQGTSTQGGGTTIVPVPVNNGLSLSGGGGGIDLGELFIYDQLFRGSGNTLPGTSVRNLGDLFVLTELFGNNGGGGLGGSNDLGDLFVLNRLFGRDTGVLSGTKGNLGDYIMLQQLFR